MNTHKNILLHLSLIDTVSPGVIKKIIKYKPADVAWNDLYYFSVANWVQFFLKEQVAQNIVRGLSPDLLAKECELLEKQNITWTTVLDPEYPELLKHIHLPPPVIYWRGALPSIHTKKVAIVGARKADQYGRQAIDLMVPTLVEHGITIVSGGALGADSMAHRATLNVGGKTVAVLGSGLLRPYPRENKKLFDQIIDQEGGVLSAFQAYTAPHPGNFPARNRIIAGMSSGVLVVQAARKSGARITAQIALEEGRDVFAIPGPINSMLSEGCHALIQEGAKLINTAEDILREYGIDGNIERVEQDNRGEVIDNATQQCILQACIYPQTLDSLAEQLLLPLSELQSHLFELQVEGRIIQDVAGMWQVV